MMTFQDISDVSIVNTAINQLKGVLFLVKVVYCEEVVFKRQPLFLCFLAGSKKQKGNQKGDSGQNPI